MAKRILVPLDRTDRAIVPVVASLARGDGATVRLLRVMPVPEMRRGDYGRPVSYVDQEMASLQGRALDDLACAEAELDGVPVESVVRFGDVVDEIALEAEAFSADLIAVGDGRRHHVSRALRPSVADRVARKIDSPVLVVRESKSRR